MTVTPDADLPVWSFPPNWKAGIRERLEWLTDVLASVTGVEQRRGLRLSPRRSLEFDLLHERQARSFLDLMLRANGGGEWMLPLWHDTGRLAEDAVATVTTSLAVDTTYREFLDGGLALIGADDPLVYEVVQIDSVADAALSLAAAVSKDWPAGAKIYPMRRGRLDDQPKLKLHTSRVGQTTVQFNLTRANDWAGAASLTSYAGLPVLETPPEWSEPVDVTLARLLDQAENEFGLAFFADAAGRAFSGQQYRWQLDGRAEHAAFRDLLYTLQGRRTPLWTPTFAEDLTLGAPALSGATAIEVMLCGFELSGAPFVGREHIRIERVDGAPLHRKITGVGTPGSVDTERLLIDSPLPAALTVEDVVRISFMDVSRLDQDAIEIHHYADTDGAADVAAVFKSFPNIRIANEDNTGDPSAYDGGDGGGDAGGEGGDGGGGSGGTGGGGGGGTGTGVPPSEWTTANDPDVDMMLVGGEDYLVQNANRSYSVTNPGADDVTLRFEVRPGDVWTAVDPSTKNRSEIAGSIQYPMGTPIQVTYDWTVEAGPTNDAPWLVAGQFHQLPNDGRSPPYGIYFYGNDKMKIVIGAGAGYLTLYADSANIVRGHVYAMEINATFDDTAGALEVIRDGVTLCNYTGPLGWSGMTSVYWKEGVYRGAAGTTIAMVYANLSITA